MNTVNCFSVRNLAIVVGVAALVFPLTVLAGQDIDETLDIPADGIITVDNTAGMIEFDTWDKNQVQVTGETGDAVEEVKITSNSKGVQIRVHNRKAKHRRYGSLPEDSGHCEH